MQRALIIGGHGTLGKALVERLQDSYELVVLSRQQTDYSDQQLAALADSYRQDAPFALIICCIGVLQDEVVAPEKRLSQLDGEVLAEYFRINSILPALCLKHFTPLLDRQNPSVFGVLSAMVGSISDNQLGGWYGYRSSKAALNMLVKTTSIEVARSNRRAAIVSIHPGTTQSPLSKPFSSRVASDKYYTPAQSAERIATVLGGLTAEDTGKFYNWDGSLLAW